MQWRAAIHLSSDRGRQSVAAAVTKHLRVLANAGVVRSVPIGRSLFELELQPIKEVRDYSIRYPSSGTMRWRG